jgi:hypothetical protein
LAMFTDAMDFMAKDIDRRDGTCHWLYYRYVGWFGCKEWCCQYEGRRTTGTIQQVRNWQSL